MENFFLGGGGITWFSTYGNGRESVVASRVLRGGTVILKIDCQLIVNEGDCQNVMIINLLVIK